MKRKIENLRTNVGAWVTKQKTHKTGGGPKPDPPPPYLEKLISLMEGPALTGIGSFVESGSGATAEIHVSDVSDSASGDGSYASGEFLMPK